MKEADGRVVGRGSGGAFISDARVTPGGPGPPQGTIHPAALGCTWMGQGRGQQVLPTALPGEFAWLASWRFRESPVRGCDLSPRLGCQRTSPLWGCPERRVPLRSECKRRSSAWCATCGLGDGTKMVSMMTRQLWREGAACTTHLELGPEPLKQCRDSASLDLDDLPLSDRKNYFRGHLRSSRNEEGSTYGVREKFNSLWSLPLGKLQVTRLVAERLIGPTGPAFLPPSSKSPPKYLGSLSITLAYT